MSDLVPLQVRAHLATGLAHAAPWGVALDGLLAAELWAEHKATARATGEIVPGLQDTPNPTDLDLPLARCTHGDPLWHWAATTAWPEHTVTEIPDIHYWSGRVDPRALEQLTTALPATISERQGRYRARYMPLLVTPCTTLVWSAIGDPTALAELLYPVTAIGKKRSHGEGHVLSWEVTAMPDLDPWSAAHLHPDGRLGRTTPTECLCEHPDLVTGGYATAGLRPPYMHPARQHTLYLPAFTPSRPTP